MAETDLYPPIKAYLTQQGYLVKGEINGCDVVAVRGDEPPVIVELKERFSLALVYQGIDRQRVSDTVYLAVRAKAGRAAMRDALGLCRRLGLGLVTVRTGEREQVTVLADPGPFQPRIVKRRRARLLREFERRVGDPEAGGSAARRPVMTAYRQDALRCAIVLSTAGPTKGASVATTTGVAGATTLMRRDVYRWFERVSPGVYALTPAGAAALEAHSDQLDALAPLEG